MSFLALDVGKKRIGLAIGSLIAEELDTLVVKEPAKSFLDEKEGTSQAIKAIKKAILDHRIEKIIVGLPLNEDSTPSALSREILSFIGILQAEIDIPIITVNEMLTSFVAEEMLKEEGLTVKEAKERVDQVSAKLILQQYLEDEDTM